MEVEQKMKPFRGELNGKVLSLFTTENYWFLLRHRYNIVYGVKLERYRLFSLMIPLYVIFMVILDCLILF